ncbi:MAG: NAD+ synthase [Candidatus Neomarinimicrobiota bacterium]|nr:MAG: NAD+ synthase [Candidatus Neomarinimicrobiota bacterium]
MELKIGIAQINPTIGDLEGNARKISDYICKSKKKGVDLLIFPEMVITGYPPQDLLFNRTFIEKNIETLERISRQVENDMHVIIGFVDRIGGKLYNGAAVLNNGRVIYKRYKTLLPNYDVFDEVRYFTPAKENLPVDLEINGKKFKIGIEICEDLWDKNYNTKITDILYDNGAQFVINISASPFTDTKFETRMRLIKEKVKKFRKPFIYANMVGSNSEVVFDGNSVAMDSDGKVIGWGKEFEETLEIFEITTEDWSGKEKEIKFSSRVERIYKALVMGIKDYLYKTGFYKAVVGVSGGIDSAVVISLAVEALGADNVLGVMMPSKYTSVQSMEDAKTLVKNLGVKSYIIPIDQIFQAYNSTFTEIFAGLPEDITEENIQARIRGNILMAISNKLGYLVLSTGNKTELALGYCTIYGDLSGGLAVISDVSKPDVYELANYYNTLKGRVVIPESILTKKPTAELKFGQVDPFDYKIVSPLVDEIINNNRTIEELIKMGYPEELVIDTARRIRRAEYKRRQAPPGIKITEKAFGIGRRFPIINKFDG